MPSQELKSAASFVFFVEQELVQWLKVTTIEDGVLLDQFVDGLTNTTSGGDEKALPIRKRKFGGEGLGRIESRARPDNHSALDQLSWSGFSGAFGFRRCYWQWRCDVHRAAGCSS